MTFEKPITLTRVYQSLLSNFKCLVVLFRAPKLTPSDPYFVLMRGELSPMPSSTGPLSFWFRGHRFLPSLGEGHPLGAHSFDGIESPFSPCETAELTCSLKRTRKLLHVLNTQPYLCRQQPDSFYLHLAQLQLTPVLQQ